MSIDEVWSRNPLYGLRIRRLVRFYCGRVSPYSEIIVTQRSMVPRRTCVLNRWLNPESAFALARSSSGKDHSTLYLNECIPRGRAGSSRWIVRQTLGRVPPGNCLQIEKRRAFRYACQSYEVTDPLHNRDRLRPCNTMFVRYNCVIICPRDTEPVFYIINGQKWDQYHVSTLCAFQLNDVALPIVLSGSILAFYAR